MPNFCSFHFQNAVDRMVSFLHRYLLDPVTAALLYLVYYAVRALPVDWASAFGGCLARMIGPLLPVQKVARNNLNLAFPDKSDDEIRGILVGMWDNIGRTFFEYPHQKNLLDLGRIDMVGSEHFEVLRDDNQAGLLWGGHLGNWEVMSTSAGMHNLELHRIYRRPNNPHIDSLFRKDRDVIKGELLAKGAAGARRATQLVRRGGNLAMLVDQKMNDGIAVPFFGRPAMTAPALAKFGLKFDCPIIPCRIIRVKGTHFRLEIGAPYKFTDTGDRALDEWVAMKLVNQKLEDWIREYPEQWLWVHRRWPKPNSFVPDYPDGSDYKLDEKIH